MPAHAVVVADPALLVRADARDDQVVVADPALLLDAEHVAPERLGHRHEGRGRFLGGDREAGVVLGQMDPAREPIGGLDAGDPGRGQFLGRAVLRGAGGALAAALNAPPRPPTAP